MPELSLGTLDYVIIVAYLIATIAIGYFVGRNQDDSSEDYFLAGRKLVWPLIGFSLYASNMSGSSFVGLASSGYANGIAVYHYEWVAALVLIVFLFFVLPFYLRSKVFTIPEFFERRFDRRSRYIFSVQTLFLNLFLDLAGGLYAGAIVIRVLFPDIPLWIAIVALTVVAGAYTVLGGLSAVVITDAIQAVVLIIGGIIVAVYGFIAIGGSWSDLVNQVPPESLQLMKPVNDSDVPWPGIFGIIIVGFYFWCLNQTIVQRTLGAKNIDHGRWGALFGGILKIPALFFLIFPGLFAKVLYPNLDNPDLAFPAIAFDLLPIGLRGVIAAALIAAIMSSVDSVLNSASTLVTMDFVKNMRPDTSDAALAGIGKICVVVFMVFAAIWAPQIANFETLWGYFQSILSYVVAPAVAIFIMGLFWKRANRHAAFWTFAIMLPLGVIAFVFIELMEVVDIHFLYVNIILFFLSLISMVAVSLMTGEPDPENIEDNVWESSDWKKESKELKGKPIFANYRLLSGVLTVCALAVVVSFW